MEATDPRPIARSRSCRRRRPFGSWADIVIDFGLTIPNIGTLSAVVVDATTLRFTFSASWLGCGQPFGVNLTRY